jgi:hypothetical protein
MEITNCIFTGLPTMEFYESKNESKYSYLVDVNGSGILVNICSGCYKTILALPMKERLKVGQMILRRQLVLTRENKFHIDSQSKTDPDRIGIKELIDNANVFSPEEKLDSLLFSLEAFQKHEGETFELNLFPGDPIFPMNGILIQEAGLYLKSLEKKLFIESSARGFADDDHEVAEIQLTLDGIQHLYKLKSEGVESNNCFVAMSFKTGTTEIREAIKSVVKGQGFHHILIDEENYDRELTINDAIIAAIKKSKFCIADFTNQSSGVYFESGFALGLGRKVIYTCRRDSFTEAHFDINHFPHIVYDNVSELKQMLNNKIEAWIK